MLKDLNPYVDVDHVSFPLDLNTDISFLAEYQCVVFTDDISFELLIKINQFCRTQPQPIKVRRENEKREVVRRKMEIFFFIFSSLLAL